MIVTPQKSIYNYPQVKSNPTAKNTAKLSSNYRFRKIVENIKRYQTNFKWEPTAALEDYPGAQQFFWGQKLEPGDSVQLYNWVMADQNLPAGLTVDVLSEMHLIDSDFVPTFDLRPPPGADDKWKARLRQMMEDVAIFSCKTLRIFYYGLAITPQTSTDLGIDLSLENPEFLIREIILDGSPTGENLTLAALAKNKTIKDMHTTIAWLEGLPSLPANLKRLEVCGKIDASGREILQRKTAQSALELRKAGAHGRRGE